MIKSNPLEETQKSYMCNKSQEIKSGQNLFRIMSESIDIKGPYQNQIKKKVKSRW